MHIEPWVLLVMGLIAVGLLFVPHVVRQHQAPPPTTTPAPDLATVLTYGVLQGVREVWPLVERDFQRLFPSFQPQSWLAAQIELSFALLALELRAATNLSPSQAELVRLGVCEAMNARETSGAWFGDALTAYDRAYDGAEEAGQNPVEAVAMEWVERAIGDQQSPIRSEVTGRPTALITAHVVAVLTTLSGTWKQLTEET